MAWSSCYRSCPANAGRLQAHPLAISQAQCGRGGRGPQRIGTCVCVDEPKQRIAYYGGVEKPFRAELFRYPGPGGWTFAPIPKKYAPPVTHGWGRTPVIATVDGHTWDTSVWWDSKMNKTLLAIPKKYRGAKGAGDSVEITLAPRS